MTLDSALLLKLQNFKKFILKAIPIPGTAIPGGDTTSGTVGTSADYARADHKHAKSNLYADKVHNHTKSDITDLSVVSTTQDGLMSTALYNQLKDIHQVVVDDEWDPTSTNPVQAAVIDENFYDKDDIIDLLNNIQTGAGKLLTIYIDEDTGDLVVDDDGFEYYTKTEVDTELNKKVDKVTGKGLSTEDYTTAEKTKLGNIEAEANKYIHPAYTARTGKPTSNQTPAFGETATISQIKSDNTGHITEVNDKTITIPSNTATTSVDGLMSSSDKTKLNGIDTGANKTVVDTVLNSNSNNPIANSAVNEEINLLSTGISGVNTSIREGLAGKEDVSNKVTSLSSSSTNTEYPSAKTVYDFVNTELNGKVDVEQGKGLSEYDFSSTYKDKLDNIKWFTLTERDLLNAQSNNPNVELYNQQKKQSMMLYLYDTTSMADVIRRCVLGHLHGTAEDGLLFIRFEIPELWYSDDVYWYYLFHYEVGDTDYSCIELPIDITDYITKSSTSGLIKNDGTIDTSTYLTSHQDISGKVNVSDIKDNLTSTDTNKPLSAKQGKILNDSKVDKITGKGLSTNDFDDDYKYKLDHFVYKQIELSDMFDKLLEKFESDTVSYNWWDNFIIQYNNTGGTKAGFESVYGDDFDAFMDYYCDTIYGDYSLVIIHFNDIDWEYERFYIFSYDVENGVNNLYSFVDSISSNSSDLQIPSAKAVHDYVNSNSSSSNITIDSALDSTSNNPVQNGAIVTRFDDILENLNTDELIIDASEPIIQSGDSTILSARAFGDLDISDTISFYEAVENGTDVLLGSGSFTNGVASYTYTGTGSGIKNIYAKSGGLVSEPYEVLDCAFYDTGTTGTPNTEWWKSNNYYLSLTSDDTGLSVENTGPTTYYLSPNKKGTSKISLVDLVDWDDFACEFKFKECDDLIHCFIQLRDANSNSVDKSFNVMRLTDGDVVKIEYTNNSAQYYKNNQTWGSPLTNCSGDVMIRFAIGNGASFKFTDFKVYPI